MIDFFRESLFKLKPDLAAADFEYLQGRLDSLQPDSASHYIPAVGEVTLTPLPGRPIPATLKSLKELIPWRKGPFYAGETKIDSEWNSECKFNRLMKVLSSLKFNNVLDIGCNNGFYMFRLLKEYPRLNSVVGLEPVEIFQRQFHYLIQSMPNEKIKLLPFGWEVLPHLKKNYDLVLNMGLLYHHSDPILLIRDSLNVLSKQGSLMIETIIIPGDGSFAAFPEKKYMGAKGFYFLPTLNCLLNWLKRAGGQSITIKEVTPFSSEEQRKTEWAPYHQVKDYINPDNQKLTMEGLPLPNRVLVTLK